jgi:ribosomal protein L14
MQQNFSVEASHSQRERGRTGQQSTKFGMTLALPVGAVVQCADNSGAKTMFVISVRGRKGRLNRLPAATVSDLTVVTVKKGKPALRKKVMCGVIVRQKRLWRLSQIGSAAVPRQRRNNRRIHLTRSVKRIGDLRLAPFGAGSEPHRRVGTQHPAGGGVRLGNLPVGLGCGHPQDSEAGLGDGGYRPDVEGRSSSRSCQICSMIGPDSTDRSRAHAELISADDGGRFPPLAWFHSVGRHWMWARFGACDVSMPLSEGQSTESALCGAEELRWDGTGDLPDSSVI